MRVYVLRQIRHERVNYDKQRAHLSDRALNLGEVARYEHWLSCQTVGVVHAHHGDQGGIRARRVESWADDAGEVILRAKNYGPCRARTLRPVWHAVAPRQPRRQVQ